MKQTSVFKYSIDTKDSHENERTPELDISIKVQYRVVGREEDTKFAVIKNISVDRCLLLVTEELPIDSEIELDMFLDETGTEAVRLNGKVGQLSRKESSLYEFEVVFNALSKETHKLFMDYFFARMYERIGLNNWPTDRRLKKEEE